jgi:hypothetical protein
MFESDGSIILDKDFFNPYGSQEAQNAFVATVNRGYNPNRDDKTGRFTFGAGKSQSYEATITASLKKKARNYDSVQEFKDSIPLVYHGSSEPLEQFTNDYGTFFTDDYMNADGYGSGENVYEGHLFLMSPKVIDAKGSMWNDIESEFGKGLSTVDIVGSVDQNKHDGVIFENVKDNWIDDAEAQDPGTIYYAYRPADSFLNDEQLTEIYEEARNGIDDRVENANPNHDKETGRFTFGDGSTAEPYGPGQIDGDRLEIHDGTKLQSFKLNAIEKRLIQGGVEVSFYNNETASKEDQGLAGYYKVSAKKLLLNSSGENPRNTFYHEIGHAIDYENGYESPKSDAFKGIRKGHPLYNDKQTIVRTRMSKGLIKKTGLTRDEIIAMSPKNWSNIQKAGFVSIEMPDGSRKGLFMMKSTLAYPSQNDEVFADGYKQFRVEGEAFQKRAPAAYELYKEITS